MNKGILKLSILAVFALLITMASFQGFSIIASEDGEIDGELTSSNYNNRASVDDFDLLHDGSSIGAGNSIDPNTFITAQVTVIDPDSIDDLNSIKFFFYYDTTTASTPGALTLNESDETDDTGSQFVAEWTRASESISVVENQDSFTWEINSFTAPAVTADYDADTFTFEIEFRVSKVANFTSSDEWYFGTVIDDGRVSLDAGSDDTNVVDKGLVVDTGSSTSVSPSGFDINFYGEIVLSQDNVSWSGVRAGDTFSSTSSSAVLSGTQYIANNTYETNIKSSEIWEAVITQEKVNEVLSGSAVDGDTDALDAFETAYNASFSSVTISEINDLIGITYGDANAVIAALEAPASATWSGIQFLLPRPSAEANLTGAALVTEAGVIDTTGFTEQFFMIGYDGSNGLSLTNTVTDTDEYGLVGTGDWRQFLPDSLLGSGSQDQTDEAGDTENVTLYLYLSSVFQNAQYSGTISIQIVNGN